MTIQAYTEQEGLVQRTPAYLLPIVNIIEVLPLFFKYFKSNPKYVIREYVFKKLFSGFTEFLKDTLTLENINQ